VLVRKKTPDTYVYCLDISHTVKYACYTASCWSKPMTSGDLPPSLGTGYGNSSQNNHKHYWVSYSIILLISQRGTAPVYWQNEVAMKFHCQLVWKDECGTNILQNVLYYTAYVTGRRVCLL